MKRSLVALVVLLAAPLLVPGCGDRGPEEDVPPPADIGVTPRATLEAYYYYKDRGDADKVREITSARTQDLVDQVVEKPLSRKARLMRGIIVDHESVIGDNAKIYHRTWTTQGAKERGGRPAVGVLVKEGGTWKMDLMSTLRETMTITKGRTAAGYYDGSKNWWK